MQPVPAIGNAGLQCRVVQVRGDSLRARVIEPGNDAETRHLLAPAQFMPQRGEHELNEVEDTADLDRVAVLFTRGVPSRRSKATNSGRLSGISPRERMYLVVRLRARAADDAPGRQLLIREAGERAGLGRVWPYMLRHSAGYALSNKGHDFRLLQDFMEHRDLRMRLPCWACHPGGDLTRNEKGRRSTADQRPFLLRHRA